MNRFAPLVPRCGRATPVQVQALEPRRMFAAVTLKHHLLTVYGSAADDYIGIGNGEAPDSLSVTFGGEPFTFKADAVYRLRVYGFGGNDDIQLMDPHARNLHDVLVDAGDGDNSVSDGSFSHTYNRAERITVVAGGGNDVVAGGPHSYLIEGGAGDDTLYGGAAGAVLDGGDGNDVVSANPLDLTEILTHADRISPTEPPPFSTAGAVALIGGAGDDVIVGNSLRLAGITGDTLSGGDGNDAFYAFPGDTIVDAGVGSDRVLGANQFTPPAAVTQTATLTLGYPPAPITPAFPAQGVGDNGPNSRIFVSDDHGTLTMQGPSGSVLLLGDLLNAAGYPIDKFGIPTNSTLKVNGFVSSLTGDQIAGYQIKNGDVIEFDIYVPIDF